MGQGDRTGMIHQRLEVSVEHETSEWRAVATVGLMIVRPPGCIIGPRSAQTGRDQRMRRRDARIERADNRRALRRGSQSLGQFGDPAVDAQPAREAFAGSGFNLEAFPESLMIPVGPSWSRLIYWVLKLGEDLPGGSVPDVVDLFTKWSIGVRHRRDHLGRGGLPAGGDRYRIDRQA